MTQGVGSLSFDAESVERVIGDLGESVRMGWADKSLPWARCRCAVCAKKIAPLPVRLEAGDALAENCGQQFVVHGVTRAEGEVAELPLGFPHPVVNRVDAGDGVVCADDVERAPCEPL